MEYSKYVDSGSPNIDLPKTKKGTKYRAPSINGSLGKTVGYCVGQDQQASGDTRLAYVTAEWLLRFLDAGHQKIIFKGRPVQYIFVDEVHERNLATDLLLWKLRELIQRTDIRLVLMSATLHREDLLEYFKKKKSKVLETPLRIESRPHVVEQLFLDDIKDYQPFFHFSEYVASSASKVVKLAKRLNTSDAYQFFSDISQSFRY